MIHNFERTKIKADFKQHDFKQSCSIHDARPHTILQVRGGEG